MELDVNKIEAIAQTKASVALAATTAATVLHLQANNQARAAELITWMFQNNLDPDALPLVRDYIKGRITVPVVHGAEIELQVGKAAFGLFLAEYLQARARIADATWVVEQLEPDTVAALSLCDLYAESERWRDIIDLTNGIENQDDTTAYLLVFRGIALRESGHHEAAREALKAANRSRSRTAAIRHRALIERARCYEQENKIPMARKDLEKILAEDASYPGLVEELHRLGNRSATQ